MRVIDLFTTPTGFEGSNSLEESNDMRMHGGFSLIEVTIAMFVLLMAILGFVPLYSYVHSNLITNRTEISAYNLAKNRVEAIKSVGWTNIGTHTWETDGNGNYILNNGSYVTVNGDPSGPFLQIKNVTENGTPISQSDCETGETPAANNSDPITYNMSTQIKWEPDQSRGFNSGVITDYKDITVEVKAVNRTRTYQDVTLSARVTMEGEQQAQPGGNIIVAAQRGWNLNPGQPIPAQNIQIQLTDPNANLYQQSTDLINGDLPGEAFFPALMPYGIWSVNAFDSNGMMVMPGTGKSGVANQTANVQDSDTAYLTVLAEIPCYLSLNFQDGVTGEPVTIDGSTDGVTLTWPSQIGTTESLPGSFSGSAVDQSVFGELWPVGAGCSGTYDLEVTFPAAGPYNDYDNSKASDWGGKFDNPGETKTVTVNLVPSPKVIVCSNSNGSNMPIPNSTASVTVQVYLDTHTYSGGAWGGPVPGADPVATGTNDSNGNVIFKNLPDNQPAPASPTADNTYDTYRMVVNAPAGYQAVSPIDDAFWVQGGYMMQCQAGTVAQVQSKVNPASPVYVTLTPQSP
jgi:Tfp pilus assembly protein PilV